MRRAPKTLGEALTAEQNKHVTHLFPTVISAAEKEAMKRAEREHAPGVAVRMNPTTFRIEYYNVVTGEIVSSHI